jgi:hypothetical protein
VVSTSLELPPLLEEESSVVVSTSLELLLPLFLEEESDEVELWVELESELL